MSQQAQIVNQEEAVVVPVSYVSEDRALTAVQIKAHADKVVEVMRSVMKKGVHYGKLPGCGDKPTLLKPGSETLLMTFRIACNPIPTDLSTQDEIRYRVEAKGMSMYSGAYLGSGIGECSSNEEKYAWRRAVCDEEWNAAPEDRRRIKWGRGKDGKGYQLKQVRTNPADLANTILKMAKKRAQIDLTLTITAASDVFQQDLEDLPDEVRQSVAHEETPRVTPVQQPERKSEVSRFPGSAPGGTVSPVLISIPQRNRFFAIYKNAGFTDEQVKDHLVRNYGIESTSEIRRSDYEEICRWAQGGSEAGANG